MHAVGVQEFSGVKVNVVDFFLPAATICPLDIT